MPKECKIEDSKEEFENAKEKTINEWIKNGADPLEAEQLFDDMTNDPYYPDQDIDALSDHSITERINQYTKIK
jgi:hypothetical protein